MGKKIVFHSVDDFPELAVSSGDTTYNTTGLWRVQRPLIDHDACTKCFICWKYCPDAAIEIIDGFPRIAYDFCKGCGTCAEECPKKCISFVQEER
jgi:2-oxoisovalerate ferredoxin oxidoreductase delta subunit